MEIDKKNRGLPNRIEDAMDIIESKLEVNYSHARWATPHHMVEWGLRSQRISLIPIFIKLGCIPAVSRHTMSLPTKYLDNCQL